VAIPGLVCLQKRGDWEPKRQEREKGGVPVNRE